MKNKALSRRRFLGMSSSFAALAFVPGSFFRKSGVAKFGPVPDIVSVKSTDYYKSTLEALNALGGMSKFVRRNSKVGLLINGNFTHPGTFTHPDISLATLKMCVEAGASEVMLIKADHDTYWQKSAHYEKHKELLNMCTRSSGNAMVHVDRGIILKEAEMIKELFELDTLINIPVAKHHDAAYLTCCLKNTMGLCTRSTNVLFHSATGRPPTDNARLAQCIADINTVRLPDLFIVDSTSFIINNGPHGPGEIQEEHKVLAGTDPVALDALCASFHDFEPGLVASIDFAAAHKLGVADISKIQIKEIVLT